MSSYWRRFKRNVKDFRRPRLALGLCLFEEGYSLDLFNLFVPVPAPRSWLRQPHEIMESWGFTAMERSIHLKWGSKYKILYMPWMYEHIKCEVLKPDGTWTKYVAVYDDAEPDGRQVWTFDYTYTLRSGERQERKATVHVERREWRWRCFTWCRLPFATKVSQYIEVEFDGEVGERTGSWKGGCIGCSYEMLPGETVEQTLRRMERERVFR